MMKVELPIAENHSTKTDALHSFMWRNLPLLQGGQIVNKSVPKNLSADWISIALNFMNTIMHTFSEKKCMKGF